jgi:peptidyl-prolyl cis-trans isomerase C
MIRKIAITAVMLGLCGWMTGCQGGGTEQSKAGKAEAAEGSTEVVAKVGDVAITLGQFENYINQQNRLVRARYKSMEQKKKLLQSLVEREAMVLEAKRLGLDKDPNVVRGLKKILARQLVNEEFNKKRAKQIDITDEEIKRFYDENHDRYHAPEKIRLHKIFISGPKSDKQARIKARVKANKLLAQLKAKPQDRRLFIQLAREDSDDLPTRRIGGDTNFKTRDQLVQEFGKVFANAAFALANTNDISPVIEDDKGFYILRQSGKQPPIDLPLEKVKQQIHTTLFARARGESYKAFVDAVRKKAGVSIFADVLDKAKVDLSDVPSGPRRGMPNAFSKPPSHGRVPLNRTGKPKILRLPHKGVIPPGKAGAGTEPGKGAGHK